MATLYVNSDWTGCTAGDVVYVGNVPHTYGTDAFSDIQSAVNAVTTTTETTIDLAGSLSGAVSISNGKNIVFTGTAGIKWKDGWFFVGRGVSGADRDAITTVTFKNANITSIDPVTGSAASKGFHISGYDSTSSSTNYGVLKIENSTIECDYLLSRNQVEISNSTVSVVNMYIHGRPASESKSGVDETATLDVKNGSILNLAYCNGLSLGAEGYGVLNLSDSAFNIADTAAWTISAKGTVNMSGTSTFTAVGGVANSGTINADGIATFDISTLTGNGIELKDGVIVDDRSNAGGAK